MKHTLLRLLACVMAVSLLAGMPLALAADGFDYAYTYTYDYWGDIRQSPDAYRTQTVITSASLGLETPMRAPQGLFVQGDDIYVCDTGNNRIIHITREDKEFKVERIIDSFTGDASPLTFSAPQDIFVNEAGEMFICDTNNQRVVKLDKELNFLLAFTKPTDATFDQSLSYLPTKLVADVSGRAFVLGKNVNKGLIKYESDGAFTGFIGASPVKNTWYEYIWKLLSTKEQRAQQESFVPTEYDNVAIDRKGFFYVVTKTFDTNELKSGAAEPIRRLNAIGSNILIENGIYWPIGDVQWVETWENTDNITNAGPSKFCDITVLDNDIYVALDSTHNRLFGYDQQGNMLWAFGGVGNQDGFFLLPVAIDHMGYDLLVLDQNEAAVTLMTPTEYGQMIYTATEQYRRGEYDASASSWLQVLSQNGNCDLAYIGVGRALLQKGEYKQACDYFKLARDFRNYSEAFRYYRSEWVEEHIGWIFAIAAVVLVAPPVVGRIRKVKEEVERA